MPIKTQTSLVTIVTIVSTIVLAVVGVITLMLSKEVKKVFIFLKKYISQKKNRMSNYFISNIPNNCKDIDFLFYQLGLRKNIPIIDWLYLEYIKFLNKQHKIKKLVIFPTIDLSATTQSKDDFDVFSENINKLFISSDIKIEIVNPYLDNYFDKEDWVSKDFIETLKYIASKKYFNLLRKEFGIQIASISDFNKHHPYDEKIKNIVTHIYRSWCIVKYISRNIELSKPKNISSIFWELEVDKLGVMTHYLKNNNNDNINFFSILGRTHHFKRNIPVPVFIDNETICMFDDKKSMIKKAIVSMPYLKKFNELLTSVLLQYENIEWKDIKNDGKKYWQNFNRSSNTQQIDNFKPTKDFFIFFGLIYKIRAIYGIT